MSIEIIKEVMDHAPDNLTAAERYALIVLAEDAWLPDREIRHDIDDEFLLKRLRLTAASWSNTRSALQRKKVLEKISGGHNGKRARYRIPFLDEAMLVNRSGEATDGSSSTGSVDQEDELVNRFGESSSTDPVDLTYITPVTPSTTPKAEGAEGSSTKNETAPSAAATAAARSVIAALSLNRQPGKTELAELVALIAAKADEGWTQAALTKDLNRDWTGARDRVRTALSRARDLADPPAASQPRASPQTKPGCAACYEGWIDLPDKTTKRCTCNPERRNP